jgi:hypothetical protein
MATSPDNLKISDDTRVYIIDELIEPYYKNVVKNTLNARQCWRKTGIAFETISKIMVAFGSIISFSAGVYEDQTLSFVSGSISCLSLAFLQFSSFSYKENKKQSEELNILLKKLGLETIPVLERSAVPQGKTTAGQQSHTQPPPPPPPQPPQLPFQLPFDMSMFKKDDNEDVSNKESTLSQFKSIITDCKESIIDVKDEILEDVDPLSNVNVSLHISSSSK